MVPVTHSSHAPSQPATVCTPVGPLPFGLALQQVQRQQSQLFEAIHAQASQSAGASRQLQYLSLSCVPHPVCPPVAILSADLMVQSPMQPPVQPPEFEGSGFQRSGERADPVAA